MFNYILISRTPYRYLLKVTNLILVCLTLCCSLINSPSSKRCFSVLFYDPLFPDGDYYVENYVMNSDDYGDTLYYQKIAAKDTIIIDYKNLPNIDMDIILTGDAFPEKINNIKRDSTFDEERLENFYYIREYSILYTEKLDTLRIGLKNVNESNIDQIKMNLENEGIIVYNTNYLSNLEYFRLHVIMPQESRKNILKRLVLNKNVRFIEVLGYIRPN